jgi:MFS family permease
MLKAVAPILQVLVGVVCLEMALGILAPTITLQLAHRNTPAELIGLIGSAYFIGFLLGTLTCHRVIDRVGHIRGFAVFAAIAATMALLFVVFDQTYVWVILRVIGGYAIAGQYVVVESWLNDKASNENRGRVFSLYMMVSWAASGISPLALNLGDPTGHLLLTLAAIALIVSLIPLGLTRIGNPEIGEREHFGLIRLYKISPTGIIACFSSGIATPAFYALLPAYMVDVGFTIRQLSFVYSFSTIAGLLAQYPIGYLADHLGRRPMMLATSLGSAGAAIGLYIVGEHSFAALAGLIFVFEGLMAPLYALGVGQTSDYIEKKDFVAASSGLLFAWGLGSAIGPAVAGGLIGIFGPRGLFLFMAGALIVFVIFLVFRMITRRAKAAREQLNYVAVPMTQGTYGAPELDPRGEPTPHPHKAIDE